MKTLVVGLLSLIFLAGYSFVYVDSPRQYVYPVGTKTSFVGSAVIVAPGVLVTANHVAKHIKVVLYKNKFVPVTVTYVDKINDVAVLQAVGIECPCVSVQKQLPSTDEEVVKVGFGLFPDVGVQNVTNGNYQGMSINSEGMYFFLFTANAAPGDSGGGVFVKHLGRYYLVGITDAVATYEVGFFPILFSSFAIAVPMAVLPDASLLGR